MVIYPIFNNINGVFIMKYLVTFAYGNYTQDYLTDVSCENYEEYSCEKRYTKISVNTCINEANNVKFYSEKVETNNNKKLITLVKEVKENCYNQHKSSDWIKLVGITPVINDEIAEVIDNLNQINSINDEIASSI